MNKWISVEDELPAYGDAVLILANSVTQHITYALNGNDEHSWFQPHYFEDNDLKLELYLVSCWMPLPEEPSKQEDQNAGALDLEEMAKNDKKHEVRAHHQEEAEQGEL